MRIAVIGGGVMGEALIAGILRNVQPTPTVVVAERRPERLAELVVRYAVQGAEAEQACAGADVVILVVKPFDAKAVLAELAPNIPQGAVLVSVVAGLSTSAMEELVPHAHAVRAMPNTPARIDAGVTGVSGGVHCPIESVELAITLMSAVGAVIHVPEDLQDAVTSVSGSGPAYVFYLAEAMLAGAREGGLSEEAARTAVIQTILGAARLMDWSGVDPAELRANVTTPNGTTAAAIATMEDADMRGTVARAIAAARARSKELSTT
mgnify:CR=1 FL=1